MNKRVSMVTPGKAKPAASKRLYWLTAGLLLIFLPACQVDLGTFKTQTQVVPYQSTGLPASTSTLLQETTPSQVSTPGLPPQTFTAQPIHTQPTTTFTPQPTATNVAPITFAAIGDFGSGEQAEADVANLILSWNPDFIITLGDNNYPDGSAEHIDRAIGQFFHSYIYPYTGNYGAGADVNKFFPSLGNHDLMTEGGKPYYDYFTLPGNERYYDFTWGAVHLFALDSMDSEPDGVGASSVQAKWLEAGLAASTSAWNLVYMHYPPYSSGTHGSTDWMRWPYKEWGADAVLAAHDHTYERLEVNGLTYFVNGVGGNGIYDFPHILDGSMLRYNSDYGAMRIHVTTTSILFEFINRDAEVVDTFEMSK